MPKPLVAILMGSDSDLPVMKQAAKVLEEFGVPYEIKVLSAHRTPEATVEYVKEAPKRGIQVFIGGAGGAAHLAGTIAANTTLPVIGVPLESKSLKGLDSLLSTAQMPKGVPVATVAIGESGAANAGLLAVQILALSDAALQQKLADYRRKLTDGVLAKNQSLTKR